MCKAFREPLSARQQDLLDAIYYHIEACGEAPSLHEMKSALGMSDRVLTKMLSSLQEKGWMQRGPRKTRAITLMPHMPAMLRTDSGHELVLLTKENRHR